MRVLWTGALALAFAATAFARGTDCIPAGECSQLQVVLPDLGGPGFPTSASWGDDFVPIFDADRFSGDDFMGMAEISNGMAVGELCNEDGNIVGSAGNTVEGGFKGDCVEVYIVAHYDFVSVINVCSSISGSASGSGLGITLGSRHCQSVEIHSQAAWSNPPLEVCPC